MSAAAHRPNRIDRFLSILPTSNGSDLHLAVGSPPILRLAGELERSRFRALTELVQTGAVNPDEALDRAIDKESFKKMIGGLKK